MLEPYAYLFGALLKHIKGYRQVVSTVEEKDERFDPSLLRGAARRAWTQERQRRL